ncbi:hypothetical protein BKA57DRAFT_467596 [Linnemannia elongata]|nr:hypothetical protein BKA57DRAFT_467596 [Linnemannia elongata]
MGDIEQEASKVIACVLPYCVGLFFTSLNHTRRPLLFVFVGNGFVYITWWHAPIFVLLDSQDNL